MSPTSAPKRLVILDAHAILHRAYHALPEFSNTRGEPTGALYGLSAMLIRIIGELKPDYLVGGFDLPKPTHRHEAYKEYKAGRKKAEDDLIAQIIRSREIFQSFGIPMYDKEGFEADDIIGTIVEKLKGRKDIEIVIASGDMDTLQLVQDKRVQVFTLKKGIQDTILYDEEAVKARFGFKPELLVDFKGLRGDTSDNIIGIKGIGEKTATILIQNFGTIEAIYKALKKDRTAFEKVGVKGKMLELLEKGEEEALFSKMLASIRRDAPIAFSLPEKTWRETFTPEAITALFTDLEFRALGARLRDVLAGKSIGKSDKAPKPESPQSSLGSLLQEAPPKDDFEEASVGLWLLNSNLTNPTLDDLLHFTKTQTFAEARKAVFEEIAKRQLTSLWETIEKPLLPIIREMDARGVGVDTNYLGKLSKEYHKELSRLEASIYELAGESFNINSPKQLGEILFVKMGLKAKNQKKTAGGALSTRESELEKLRESHPVIALILEYRELQKLLSTYIDTIPSLVDKNGRLHAHFLQAGTTTGRMSSENPNLQNIPNKSELGKKIRHAFVAAKGMKLVAFDYSQIELRIAAFLSGDKKLIDVFRKGEDVHTSVASEVFGVPKEAVTKDMRRKAKVINFGIIYGMGVNALKANLGTTREEAQAFYNEYFATFSGLASYLDRVRAEAERTGYTETFFGRRRYFEGIRSKIPYIKAAAERMAINAPIQGTEADIIKRAMVEIDRYIAQHGLKEKAHLILQVHDELVYEIEEGEVSHLAPEIMRIMESVLPPEKTSGVVCKAEGSVGENWGSMEKLR